MYTQLHECTYLISIICVYIVTENANIPISAYIAFICLQN